MAAEVKRGDGRWNTQSSLEELALLADTAGARVVGWAVQRLERPHPATYIGQGKVREIASQRGSMGYTTALLSIVATIITFVLNFASIDMSRDAYQGETLDLGESVSYVTGRIVEFIVAAIVGGLMAVTIILIPVVILMFVVMVMDETGITDAVSKSLNVLRADLGDVLLILLVSIVGSFVISYVPFVSALLDAALNVVIGLAFIDLYANYKSG